MLSLAEEINNTKDSAQASLALKKLFKRPRKADVKLSLKTFTKHYKSTFYSDNHKHIKMGNVVQFNTAQ